MADVYLHFVRPSVKSRPQKLKHDLQLAWDTSRAGGGSAWLWPVRCASGLPFCPGKWSEEPGSILAFGSAAVVWVGLPVE